MGRRRKKKAREKNEGRLGESIKGAKSCSGIAYCVLPSDWWIKTLKPFLVGSGRKGAEGYNIITNSACFLKVISNSGILYKHQCFLILHILD